MATPEKYRVWLTFSIAILPLLLVTNLAFAKMVTFEKEYTLLYRVTGHPEESLKVLERLFILMPKTPRIESTQIYNEARSLYSEIKAETDSKATAH